MQYWLNSPEIEAAVRGELNARYDGALINVYVHIYI